MEGFWFGWLFDLDLDTRTVMAAHLEQTKIPIPIQNDFGQPAIADLPLPLLLGRLYIAIAAGCPSERGGHHEYLNLLTFGWRLVWLVHGFIPRMEECDIHRQEIRILWSVAEPWNLGRQSSLKNACQLQNLPKTMRFCNHLNISQEKLAETWWKDHWGIDILQPTAEEQVTVFMSAAAATAAMPRCHGSVHVKKGWPRTIGPGSGITNKTIGIIDYYRLLIDYYRLL